MLSRNLSKRTIKKEKNRSLKERLEDVTKQRDSLASMLDTGKYNYIRIKTL